MGQHGLLSYLLSLEAEGPLFYNRSCQHLVARFLFYCNGLSCDHRFVNVGRTLAHADSIDGNPLARSHLDRVARLECRNGSLGDGTVCHEMGRFRL